MTAGSAGNHAQAIAFAAQHFGLGCEIFVPAGASIGKIEAVSRVRRDGHRGRRVVDGSGRRPPRRGRPPRAGRSVTRSMIRSWSPARARSGWSCSTTSTTWRWSSSRSVAAGWRPGLAIAIKSMRRRCGSWASRPPRVRRTSGHAAAGRSGRDAGRRDRREVARCDHAAARRTLDRRDRHRRRGVDRRRDGAADGARQALRRGRRGGRRGSAARRPRGVLRRPARRASCSRAATSTSAWSRA